MIWDKFWNENEKAVAKLSHEKWLQIATKCVSHAVAYLSSHAKTIRLKKSVLATIVEFEKSISSRKKLSKEEEAKLESLIEVFSDDDLNSEKPGVWDILMSFEFFTVPKKDASIDDLADCLSYCYQCIYGVEVFHALKVGEGYTEDESEVVELASPSCVQCVDFQRETIKASH